MDITPASLRDASFALTPTGCNPVQVEEALARIAEHLEAGEEISADLVATDFETVSAGFSPDEVAAFFDTLRAALTGVPADPCSTDEDVADDEPAAPTDEPEAVSETRVDDVSPASGARESHSPSTGAASRRPATYATGPSLPSAVERTKLAVSELETFVVHQMEEAKSALRLHIDQTQTDCQNTLDTARTISDQALDTARQRAEVLLDVATRTTNQLRDRFDSELAGMRAAFEEDLARRHAAIQAELEALVAEARTLTDEAHGHLVEVHDDVRASLEDARSVLSNPDKRLAA